MPLKVLLVGNYKPDDQESMERFCSMMAQGLKKHNVTVTVIRPEPLIKRGKSKTLAKWLGYIDKFILFPVHLKKAASQADIVHICDHSNSPYVKILPDKPHLITCHDLLAVRAGLGEETHCPISKTGKVLQLIILHGLKEAKMIVCDSGATKQDAERLVGRRNKNICHISLGLNYPFQVLVADEVLRRLGSVKGLDSSVPFLLHVGSSQPRKNRDGILRIFAKVKDRFTGQLVFAGSPLTDDLRSLSKELGVSLRVVEIVKPSDKVLEALYNRAFALLFPSYSEGFGWPIIEAQACGCPAIISNCRPCPEVAGQGALVHELTDENGFAASILRLLNGQERQKVIAAGFENLKNYDSEKMVTSYLTLYHELATNAPENS